MAIIYPTLEDQEKLVQFATSSVRCSSEDIKLLGTTCASLIADVVVINEFILSPSNSFFIDASGPQTRSDVAFPPIHYCRGYTPPVLVSSSNVTSTMCDLFYRTEGLFRPHEASLRALQHRLQQGKAAMTKLNEKYNYAFTVVTFGKVGQGMIVKGETSAAGTDISVQTVSATEQAPEVSSNKTISINGGSEECGKDGRRVYVTFMNFLQTFDLFISWVSSLVGILDGEGAAPSSGTYVVHEQPEKETTMEEDGSKKNDDEHIHTRDKLRTISPAQACDASPTKEPLQEEAKGLAVSSPSSVGNASSTRPRRSRIIRVTRYELHDVNSIFRLFQTQASLFYLLEYTFYDPRLRRRLLLPEYYRALSETIRDIGLEIERLQQHKDSLSKDRSIGRIIIFSPTICEFCYIRDTLRLYWSLCIVEDDITALHYHRMQYNKCVLEVGDVIKMLKQLHRPPASVATDISSSNFDNYNGNNSAPPSSSKDWVLTPEERGAIEAGFEDFWCIRERVLKLCESLTKDIQEKDRTHRYRMPAIPPPPPTAATKDAEKGGNFKQWMLSTVNAWKQIVTCGVEISEVSSTLERDDGRFLLSTHSPQYESKVGLLHLVQRLVTAVEAQGTILERDFPGTFYRDTKTKWSQRATGIVRYLESVSVVFSPPG
ncbi:hypothetical protein BCY84_16039 [Trypanosoma cruzi cruzi]|nr:hypothetical protein BCY84_16043 [Trypanosoma cruzi cruzi]PBJ72054.1 hypothetical protein BCY84_16039 [Trypanosoma cruzi cruzi]